MKLKPIKFSDVRDHKGNGLAEGVSERKSTFVSDHAEHGRSYYIVRCGFCENTYRAYKWSLRGGGKRCPDCKAIMGSTGQTYQWSALVAK